jgi:16S rRNA (cytidine1402-2'-O)-methyltransferase
MPVFSSTLSPSSQSVAALTLVATPIGNLGDMTLRAVRILQEVDVILCEDTRTSQPLLNHYDIRKPLEAYHDHNEQQRAPILIARMQQGERFALISDAGMPLMADPGYRLVSLCQDALLRVSVAPGPSAIPAALALSGLSPHPFVFLGFFPSKDAALGACLQPFVHTPATLVGFETAPRLVAGLRRLYGRLGNRQAAVVREISKRFEEVQRGTLERLMEYYHQHPPKGEIVLVIEGNKNSLPSAQDWQTLLQEALITRPLPQAVREVATLSGVSKREVYQYALTLSQSAATGYE